MLESSITLIDGGRLYYRGHDAVELARTRSIAEVASLHLDADGSTPIRREHACGGAWSVARGRGNLPFVARAQAALALAAAHDPLAFDLRPEAVRTGWRHPRTADTLGHRPRCRCERRSIARWRARGT